MIQKAVSIRNSLFLFREMSEAENGKLKKIGIIGIIGAIGIIGEIGFLNKLHITPTKQKSQWQKKESRE